MRTRPHSFSKEERLKRRRDFALVFADGKAVAAVDFQYVGAGCGMKDVAYLLGSCLDDKGHEALEADLLDY